MSDSWRILICPTTDQLLAVPLRQGPNASRFQENGVSANGKHQGRWFHNNKHNIDNTNDTNDDNGDGDGDDDDDDDDDHDHDHDNNNW